MPPSQTSASIDVIKWRKVGVRLGTRVRVTDRYDQIDAKDGNPTSTHACICVQSEPIKEHYKQVYR